MLLILNTSPIFHPIRLVNNDERSETQNKVRLDNQTYIINFNIRY